MKEKMLIPHSSTLQMDQRPGGVGGSRGERENTKEEESSMHLLLMSWVNRWVKRRSSRGVEGPPTSTVEKSTDSSRCRFHNSTNYSNLQFIHTYNNI